MVKVLAVRFLFLVTASVALPTISNEQKKEKGAEKIVAIIPVDHEDLKTSETFYSGYHTGYPGVGVSTGLTGGYGWKGGHGGGDIGYGGGYGGGYGYGAGYGAGYGPVYGSGYGSPPYGWRQGPNRWSLI